MLWKPVAAELVTPQKKSFQKSANTHTTTGIASKAEKRYEEGASSSSSFSYSSSPQRRRFDATPRIPCHPTWRPGSAGLHGSCLQRLLLLPLLLLLLSTTSPAVPGSSGTASGGTGAATYPPVTAPPCGSGSSRTPGRAPVALAVFCARRPSCAPPSTFRRLWFSTRVIATVIRSCLAHDPCAASRRHSVQPSSWLPDADNRQKVGQGKLTSC